MKPPKKPESLKKIREQRALWNADRLKDKDFYPCVNCYGRGRVYNNDDCDPIEGYKLATLYKCTFCNGTGSLKKIEFNGWYRKKYLEPWKKEAKEYKKFKASIRPILDKLTRAEITKLRKWWGVNG